TLARTAAASRANASVSLWALPWTPRRLGELGTNPEYAVKSTDRFLTSPSRIQVQVKDRRKVPLLKFWVRQRPLRLACLNAARASARKTTGPRLPRARLGWLERPNSRQVAPMPQAREKAPRVGDREAQGSTGTGHGGFTSKAGMSFSFRDMMLAT